MEEYFIIGYYNIGIKVTKEDYENYIKEIKQMGVYTLNKWEIIEEPTIYTEYFYVRLIQDESTRITLALLKKEIKNENN